MSARLNRKRVDVVPEGHWTARQWGEHWDRSRAVVSEMLRDAIAKGEFGTAKYRMMSPNGSIKLVPHYWKK